jgi:DNA polymerase-1
VFEAYKGHREEMPENLRKAIPYVARLIQAWGIPLIMMDGFEADDIIGTLAHKAADKGYTVFMMTPDKDFGQLVRENVYIYKPARMGNGIEILGVPEVLAKWEIERVEQVTDILGLWGDASDNIPGIPGIGEKTSKLLIQKYGSVENIIANAHELKGKQKENVIQFAEQGILSKQLATIDTAVPVELDEEALIVSPPHSDQMRPLLEELEFRTLTRRILGSEAVQTDLFGQEIPAAKQAAPKASSSKASSSKASSKTSDEEPSTEEQHSYQTYDPSKVNYHLVVSAAETESLAAALTAADHFCFDTEISSLDPITGKLVGLSFCMKEGEACYVSVVGHELPLERIIECLKPAFEHEGSLKIGQNIKFDIQVLKQQGVEVKGKCFDTMIAHYLLEPDMRHGMDFLSETYLHYRPISITELIGKKGKDQGTMLDVDPAKVAIYASEDADITYRLYRHFEPLLEPNGVKSLFDDMEMPLVRVLADMELNGVSIDVDALALFSKELEQQAQLLEQEIYSLAGTKFNIASPKQLGEVLFDLLKLDPKAKKTATGQYKTDEEVLGYLALQHPIAAKVLQFRGVQKLKSTYVDALPGMINPKTGKVHTSYHQAVAATGRLSSQNPNLQNIPIRTDQGKEVRKAFVPSAPDRCILSADYSQIELRLIAEIAGDEQMLEAFSNGLDIHTATAAKVFHVELDQVTADHRRKAKMVNFGIIYGISAFGLQQRLGIPRAEAAALIQSYFETYPGIRTYMDTVVARARETGYVETLKGRRRYLRDIQSANATVRGFAERNAINAPIQGSAADLIKLAMIDIDKKLKEGGFQSKMIMQVHDELVFDTLIEEKEAVRHLVITAMCSAMKTKVPLEAEAGFGSNWLEAH